jgi:uncharacterized protein (TIGR02594 family)
MKPVWMDIAEKEIGQAEVRGGENPRIIEYHATTTLKAKEDEVPWCSAFVNWCLLQAGIKGTNSAAAKSWLTWGEEIEVPEYGCICVIRKVIKVADPATGSSSGYHVAFWLRDDGKRVWLLGGNQGDTVKEMSFGLAGYEICGYRIPKEAG